MAYLASFFCDLRSGQDKIGLQLVKSSAMKDREFRGGSEPPAPPTHTQESVNDKTGLRRVPIKIAGVAMGSVEQLTVTVDGEGGGPRSPWTNKKNWRRSVTPNRGFANGDTNNGCAPNGSFKKDSSMTSSSSAMPFGANPIPAVCPKMQFPKRGKRSSSVSNIVAALEGEISTWKRNNTAQRDYSGLLGWNTKSTGAQMLGNSHVESTQVPTKAQTVKFEPRKESKLERFFTFGDTRATNGTNLKKDVRSSLVRLCDGGESGSRNLSEVNGGDKMGEITDGVGRREGRLQSQERRRRGLSFDGQTGEGREMGDGHGLGESPTIATVKKTDSEKSNSFLFEKCSIFNSVESLRQKQESGLFQSDSSVSENGQEGVTIKAAAAEKEEKERKEDGALTSGTVVSEYFALADLECATQGSSLGKDETREEKKMRAEEGVRVGQNFETSTSVPPSVDSCQDIIEEMTSDNRECAEYNRSIERSEKEHDSLHRCSSLLRRPVDFMMVTCSYGGSTSRGLHTEMAKNARRSPTRSPLPSPSRIRKYLSEGSGSHIDKKAPPLSPNLNGSRDIKGGAWDGGPNCDKVMQGLEVKNGRNVAFQDAIAGTRATAASVHEVTETRISENGEFSFCKGDETPKESSLSNLQVQEPGLKHNDALGVPTEVLTSTEEDVVEMGPENVKIHESVIPRIKITEKSSYYTGATSLENELSWAKDTKMKV